MDLGEIETPGDLTKIASLAELEKEGFVAFSLGPLYIYGGVNESLPRTFAREYKEKKNGRVFGTTMRFERPILSYCDDWNFVLDVMDKRSFGPFTSYMNSLNLISRDERKYFAIRRYEAPILDPLALDLRKKKIPTVLTLFSVSGLKGSVVPRSYLSAYDQALPYIVLEVKPPEPQVVAAAEAAFGELYG